MICRGKKSNKKMVGSKTVSVEWGKVKNIVVALREELSVSRLRSKARTLSDGDVYEMLVKHNLFDAKIIILS